MSITEEQRELLNKKIQQSLRELGLLDSHSLWISRADIESLVITVAPKGRARVSISGCQTVTVRGRQCKFNPAPGERLCQMHLTMSKEGG